MVAYEVMDGVSGLPPTKSAVGLKNKQAEERMNAGNRKLLRGCYLALFALVGLAAGCKPAAAPQQQAMQAMPVRVMPVVLEPVSRTDTYVATIKSRRSATIQPQVDGSLVRINVHSGEQVSRGQVLMEIDPQKQLALVQAAKATEQQLLAVYEYNQVEVERQKKLFEAGVTSREAKEQAEQAFKNSKASYDSAVASRQSQEAQLQYYRITAPFNGVVGDIPVHVGDYVSPTSATSALLTTVDDNTQLEAYIDVPAERAAEVKMGIPVEILDGSGKTIEQTRVGFVSPEVDNGLQGILVKAPVHSTRLMLRNSQIVKARLVWGSAPVPVVPVLAVSRIGSQAFVFVVQRAGSGYVAHQTAVQLGDTQGNSYSVISGLHTGEQVIISGVQMLAEGFPIQPMS